MGHKWEFHEVKAYIRHKQDEYHTHSRTPYIPSSSKRVTTMVYATQLRWPLAPRTTAQTAESSALLDKSQHRSTLLSYDDLRL